MNISLDFTQCNQQRWALYICCCCTDTKSREKWKCMLVLTRMLPGCVWDWSRPTLWLLPREILRADWCLVARRLGHLGRGRHCCGRILIWVTGMVRKVQESIHSDINNSTVLQRGKKNDVLTKKKEKYFHTDSTETALYLNVVKILFTPWRAKHR